MTAIGIDLQESIARPAPFLRWAGSKRSQIAALAEYWSPAFDRYVEPFAGSARLFFAIQPRNALLSDNNGELINLFHVICRFHRVLHKRLMREARSRSRYEQIRKIDPVSLSPLARAVRFLYLNRNCFNGLYRTNAKGAFNVPMGNRLGDYPTASDLSECAAILRQADIVEADFEETVSRVEKGDFVYLDPPYARTSARSFRAYGAKPFSVCDITRLSRCARRIDDVGGKFLISYAACPEIQVVAQAWSSRVIEVRRHLAGFASNRRTDREIMITNIDSAHLQHEATETKSR